jgi:hypothetical protein
MVFKLGSASASLLGIAFFLAVGIIRRAYYSTTRCHPLAIVNTKPVFALTFPSGQTRYLPPTRNCRSARLKSKLMEEAARSGRIFVFTSERRGAKAGWCCAVR